MLQKKKISSNRTDFIDEIAPKNNNYRSSFKVQYRLSAFKEFRKENEEVTKKKRYKKGSAYETFKEFCKHNTLHGLPYVGDNTLAIGERIFWAIVTASSFILAIFFISSIYQLHSNAPIIENIHHLPHYIKDYPFPAVTICVTYIITDSTAKEILLKRDPTEMEILNYVCYGKMCNRLKTINKTDDVRKIRPEIIKSMVLCDRILKNCQFGGEQISCKKSFKQIFTKIGSCCTFNQMSNEIMYRYEQPPFFNYSYSSNVVDWTLQRGYPNDMLKSFWPRRSKGKLGAGLNSGLIAVLDMSNISAYCENVRINQLTFFLHKPTDQPELIQPSAIALGYETAVQVLPKLRNADPFLRKIHPDKRGCYFDDERRLGLYRRYSPINCINECVANITYSTCGCIPIFYPQYKEWKICRRETWCCVYHVLDPSNIQNIEGVKRYTCSCLEDCETLDYNKIESYGSLVQMAHKENILKNHTNEYITKNMAVLNVFFKSTTFVATKKQPLYNFSQYLSNVGGILALFMGFSFFTAAELIYYGFFKIFIHGLEIVRPKVAKPTLEKGNSNRKRTRY